MSVLKIPSFASAETADAIRTINDRIADMQQRFSVAAAEADAVRSADPMFIDVDAVLMAGIAFNKARVEQLRDEAVIRQDFPGLGAMIDADYQALEPSTAADISVAIAKIQCGLADLSFGPLLAAKDVLGTPVLDSFVLQSQLVAPDNDRYMELCRFASSRPAKAENDGALPAVVDRLGQEIEIASGTMLAKRPKAQAVETFGFANMT